MPSRRAVLISAWTTPVIVAASAAPSFATSAQASLVFDTLTSYGADYSGATATTIETKIQVRREYSPVAPDVTSITVSMNFPTTVASGGAATLVTGSGWTAEAPSGSKKTSWTYTFVWTGTLTNSHGSTPELLFRIRRKAVESTRVTLTAYATSPQATIASRTNETSV